MKIYLDGEYVDEADARISVFDHGLLYGDGVFEGIRLYGGCVFRLDEHLERLEFSAKAILLDLPLTREEFSGIVCETCRRNQLSDGYIRLIVTRGKGNLGLSPVGCKRPTVIVIADKIALYPDEYYEKGLDIVTVPTRRINPAALNPAVKSLNYLNNVLARIEASQHGAPEAIMLNDQGFVSECTGDNIFMLSRGTLYTPDTSCGALKGITRDTAIDIARELEIPVVEANLTRYDFWTAEECFLTGTAAEVVPVVRIDGREVGDGRPGALTQRFIDRFRKRATREGTRI
jgi:branched-chain amino acid aminotransferase